MAPPIDELTDSTDWLPTSLSSLAPIESSLRCQVCKDFFSTPMITSCAHTFCSLCIRRYLSQEGRCPACREQDQEMKLRRNWVVEELVFNWKAQRSGLMNIAARLKVVEEETTEQRPKKRRKVVATQDVEGNGVNGRRSTRSHTKQVASQTSGSQRSPLSTQSDEVPDSDGEGSVYSDAGTTRAHSTSKHFEKPVTNGHHEPDDGLVVCPSCSRRMKENLVNAHLDKCLAGEISTSSPEPPHVVSGAIAYTQRKPASQIQQNRLPTLNYSILSETQLRKKLKELGLPIMGSKEHMRKRHVEWMNLWNANCDSREPVGKKELLKSLDIWERTLGREVEKNAFANGGGDNGTGIMGKQFDRDGYMKKQKDDFDDLIKKAKEKRMMKKQEAKPVGEPEATASISTVDFGSKEEAEQPDVCLVPGTPVKEASTTEMISDGFSKDVDGEIVDLITPTKL